ncbi:MAG: glycosyltransferase, partial [Lachnospiraceae bacterium]|nr:glycosyltransferase [Lachnospiraceae bacterium]
MRDRRAGKPEKRRVLILVNHDVVIYNFRLELVERLLEDSYEVHISSPYGERIEDLERIGAHYHRIEFDRHGMSPLEDGRILLTYLRLIATLSPRIVLGYTIKPNLYGAVAARFFGVPFVANITGLGTALEKDGFRKYLVIAMYKLAFLRIRRVFFQNLENERFFRKYRIAVHAHALLPGSGVNLSRFPEAPYPVCGDGKTGEPVLFAFISRIMKEKGIEQFLRMARAIHRHYPQTEFHVYGFCEAEYEGALAEWGEKQVVRYHGMVRDVAAVMSEAHCIVHPTYYPEGISNVLLEA